MMGVALLFTLAATDVLIGIASLGIFWPVFALAVLGDGLAGRLRMRLTSDSRLLVLAMLLMFGSALMAGAARATTLAYASLFTVYGLWLAANAGTFTTTVVAKAMKAILVAYFVSSLLATLLIQTGQLELKDFLLTRIYIQENTGEARPLGFSSEPSYAAFIVALCWITLLRIGAFGAQHVQRWLPWTLLAVVSLTMLGSIYGYLLTFIIVGTSAFRFEKRTQLWLLGGLFALLGIAYLFGATPDGDSRSLRVLYAIASGDLDEWLIEDTSSFFRFGPFLTYVLSANFGDPQTWFGHGAGSSGFYFVDLFREHIEKNLDAVELGFVPAFLYDYGLVAAIAFLAFLFRATRGPHRVALILITGLMLFNANFNTQLMWFAVTCAFLSRDAVATAPSSPS
ncbi:hypothetical protein [Roseateles sp. P5_E7]